MQHDKIRILEAQTVMLVTYSQESCPRNSYKLTCTITFGPSMNSVDAARCVVVTVTTHETIQVYLHIYRVPPTNTFNIDTVFLVSALNQPFCLSTLSGPTD